MNTHVKPPAGAVETFATAFVKLQSDIRPAIKDANNPAFRSKYADLGAVWEAIKEPLSRHGFSVIQSPDFDGDSMWLRTTVLHVSGERMEGRYPLRPVKQDPQGFGSALTYARRYSLSAMLGVISEDDDDGNSASGRHNAPSAPPSQRDVIHNSPTMAQDDDVTAGVKNWVEKEKHFLNNCVTVGDVTAWKELRADELARLKRKAMPAWSELMKWSEARIGNINLGGK
jgi:hypothetical protein